MKIQSIKQILQKSRPVLIHTFLWTFLDPVAHDMNITSLLAAFRNANIALIIRIKLPNFLDTFSVGHNLILAKMNRSSGGAPNE